jgi:alginate O-acetyltransferase complex protein AlgI
MVDFAPLDFLLKLPLPIGISFFVFHNISLLVDLTRQRALTAARTAK